MFGKKSTSRLCENPLVQANQIYIHAYSTRCTEHIIPPDPDLNIGDPLNMYNYSRNPFIHIHN